MEQFEQFMEAVMEGDIQEVRNNWMNEFGERFIDNSREDRPLHVACEKGHVEIVKILIENNCDIECSNKEKSKPIHIACRFGRSDIAQLLIEKKCNIESETLNNRRPIHIATKFGYIDIIKILIENDCKIECEDENKRRPIHYACLNGNIDIVQLLIESKCDIECVVKDNWRPIHFACYRGYAEIVQLLIDKGCNIECEDKDKWRPIHFASSMGYANIVRLLIEKNCNIECEDKDKKTPYDLSCANRHFDIIGLFIEECIFKNSKNLIEKSEEGVACKEFVEQFSKIFSCIREMNVAGFIKEYENIIKSTLDEYTNVSIMNVAIKYKADTIVDDLRERTINDQELIYLTKVVNQVQRFECTDLIKEGILYRCIRDCHADGFYKFCTANVVNGPDPQILSPFLQLAAEHGRSGFIDQLMKSTIYSKEVWNTAKDIAMKNKYYDIVENISNRQTLLELRFQNNFSLLHTAVCDNDADMVRYILEKKLVDANISHNISGTALALAHSLCHKKCISILEEFNVNVNTQNKYMQTPLHEAIESGTYDQCRYLLEKCDDVDRVGFNNLTALHCAVMKGCPDLCKQLVQHGANYIQYTNMYCQYGEQKINNVFLSKKENALTLCMKFHGTIYECFQTSKCRDINGNSLLHLAAICLQPHICKSLIDKKNGLIKEVNNEGNNCLQELLLNVEQPSLDNNIGRIIETVEVLIDYKVDLSAQTRTGFNILQLASKMNNEKLMLSLLYEDGNRIVVKEEDVEEAFEKKWFQYGEKLLKYLPNDQLSSFIKRKYIKNNLTLANKKLIKYLFENASTNVQQKVLEKDLIQTALNDVGKLFDFFVNKMIFMGKRNKDGETLLTRLLKEKKTKYCMKLIESQNIKCYINLANDSRQLPLQVAIEMNEIDIVKSLIGDTNEINNKDEKGETALTQLLTKISNCDDEKMGEKILELIKLVIDKGGDIDMQIDGNKRVIEYCTNLDFRKIIEQYNQSQRMFRRKT